MEAEAIQVDQEDEGIGTGPQVQVQGQPTLGLVDLIQGLTMDPAQAQAFAAIIQQMVTTSVAGAQAGGAHGGGGGGAGEPGWIGGSLGRLPLYPPKVQPGDTPFLPDFSRHITAIKTYLSLRRVTVPGQQKDLLFLSLEGGASRRLSEEMSPNSPTSTALTFEAYCKLLSSVFEPSADSELARASFQSCKQGSAEDIQSFYIRKLNLFKRAYVGGSQIHFIDSFLSTVYHSKVREEILRSKPSTCEELYSAACDAVAFVRRLGGSSQSHKGLASVLGYESLGSHSQAAEPMELGQLNAQQEEDYQPNQLCGFTSEEMNFIGSMENEDDFNYWNSLNQLTTDQVCWHCQKSGHRRAE